MRGVSGVVPGHQVVGELDGVLRAGDLSRVQPSVDMHDHFPGVRQRMRIGFAQPLHQRQPPRRVTDIFQDRADFARRK